MDSSDSLLSMKKSIQNKSTTARQSIQNYQVQQNLSKKREDLFGLMKQQIKQEFEDFNNLPDKQNISKQQENQLKGVLDNLIASNIKKKAQYQQMNQKDIIVDIRSQTVQRYSQSLASNRLAKRAEVSIRINRTSSDYESSNITSTDNQQSEFVYNSQYWNKVIRVHDDDPRKKFKLIKSYYVPLTLEQNESTINQKLSDLKTSQKYNETAYIENQSMSKILEHQTHGIKKEITKITLQINDIKQGLDYANEKEGQFVLMKAQIQYQNSQDKNSRQFFNSHCDDILERAGEIKKNKETIIHNLSVESQNPTNNYTQGRLNYIKILPKRQEQETKIIQLNNQEENLRFEHERLKEAGQNIYVLMRIKHLFINSLIVIDWERFYFKFRSDFIRSPKNLIVLWISKALISLKSDMIAQIVQEKEEKQLLQKQTNNLNYIDIFYFENPKGPHNLVDKLITIYETLTLQMNIKMLDAESLNDQKKIKFGILRQLLQEEDTLSKFDAIFKEKQMHQDDCNYKFKNSIQDNPQTQIRMMNNKISHSDKLSIRIFWSLFQSVAKIMQMIGITHSKVKRFFTQTPKSITLIDVGKQMELIFKIKEIIVRRQQINNIPRIQQEDNQNPRQQETEQLNLIYSDDTNEKTIQFDQVNDDFDITVLIDQLLKENVNILNKLWIIIPNLLQTSNQRVQLLIDSSNYKKLQETQTQVYERLQKYIDPQTDPEIQIQEHKIKLNKLSQNAIVHIANKMQLDQIRHLKSSIIIERRKKDALRVQDRLRRQQEKDKALDFFSVENFYLNKTHGAIKAACKTEATEDIFQEESGIVDHIFTLQAIQNNKLITKEFGHQRLWSQELQFNQTQSIKRTMSRQHNLLHQMVSEINISKHTDVKQKNLRKYLTDLKFSTMSQQNDKVVKLKQMEQRKSFVTYTSRSAYSRQKTIADELDD